MNALPYPNAREPGWPERSSWARAEWERELSAYWETLYALRGRDNGTGAASATARLRAGRENYRHRVLGWYGSLCLPLGLDMVVPNEVASLMFEQWDLDGCPVGDAIFL